MRQLALINHGCAKNLVDSELILGILTKNGYEITLNEDETDIVIVNTCSFIHDAEKESVQSILQIVNSGKKVIVTGCLPQKHKEELKEAIPEVCAMVCTTDFKEIVSVVEKVLDEQSEEYISKISEKPEIFLQSQNNAKRHLRVTCNRQMALPECLLYSCV